ncbi:Lea domain-containing protein [Mycena venus]|uniref:Lea domain-containing protein n=1 Tax=Mycena venus TaxID=2733690 RepID=A0A8H6X791_9AGAR|nr:Lea domain-containing protein [Mycena venus]
MSDIDAQEQQHMNVADQGQTKPTDGTDQRTDQEKETDRKLAERLSHIIEDANQKCLPLCNMIRKVDLIRSLDYPSVINTTKHIEQMESQKEEDRDENELVKSVKPLLQQAEQILNETNGAIRGADPDNRLSNKAKRNMQDHKATPDEQRLAEALKVVRPLGIILPSNISLTRSFRWFKKSAAPSNGPRTSSIPSLRPSGISDLSSRPWANPLTQIVGGVGLLLAGVLNLVNKLLSALGLDSLLKGIVAATGLDKIYKGLGLGNLMKM